MPDGNDADDTHMGDYTEHGNDELSGNATQNEEDFHLKLRVCGKECLCRVNADNIKHKQVGSEDVGNVLAGNISHAATSTSKQPIASVVELGEIHAESTNRDRPVPQSLNSLRPPQDENAEAVAAETRAAMLALGPDIGSQLYEECPQET
ncbi:hypothetical protein FOYG_00213 [Fusarium oxysporum NRRL 32931]|uniref:Uncharacterized protein n=1 Tax=Fusarium oxysporum NRRL 32931 TaxID=660029 RepID=W9J3Z7_FUSOX|nr:hypothetical protein FOYG_00213 [Fusarium oxysporum NRRL 32931]